MLQESSQFFLGQPMIYFGTHEGSYTDIFGDPLFVMQFDANPFFSKQQDVGLFLHWHQLPDWF